MSPFLVQLVLAARAYSNCMKVINQPAAGRRAGKPGSAGRVKSLGPKRGIEKGERERERKREHVRENQRYAAEKWESKRERDRERER